METRSIFGPYTLRPLRAEDAADIFAAISTQREYLGRWLPFVAATQREEHSREAVAGMLANPDNPVFSIRDGGAFAGLIGFKSADRAAGTIEIGYWLREEYQGRGIVTAAVRRLCDRAFEDFGMRRVEIRCATGNLPSNRIPRRLGFRADRLEEHAEQLADGTRVDLQVYVLEATARDAGTGVPCK